MDKSAMVNALVEYYANGNKARFANILGVSAQTISAWITRKTFDAELIYTKCSDISANWLLSGSGRMLRSDTDTPIATAELTAVGGIPLIPIEAMAGVLSGNSAQVMEQECEHYNIPMFKGAEFLIRISGDSMQPKYYSGDIVACKRLPLDTFFQWNRVYVVDSEQGVIIKRVRRGSDDRHIVFVSDNTAYEPFELPLDKIYSIALVVGVVRAE
ncbi:S24 family peptidase [uncultured Alistipes sp.]|uniref:LexA family transcriptional regulator n=1 Tax=uncultured Alistipes sp. TaxID=538949 RepID=UPI00272970F7|nr:S24 family peptidase [uncultured Alistipes sp.]